MTAIAACLLGLVVGYLAYSHSNFGLPANVEVMEDGIFIRNNGGDPDDAAGQAQALPGCLGDSTDMAEAVPEQPADDTAAAGMPEMAATAAPPAAEVVTDTVKPGNYLSVMARAIMETPSSGCTSIWKTRIKSRIPTILRTGWWWSYPPPRNMTLTRQARNR